MPFGLGAAQNWIARAMVGAAALLAMAAAGFVVGCGIGWVVTAAADLWRGLP